MSDQTSAGSDPDSLDTTFTNYVICQALDQMISDKIVGVKCGLRIALWAGGSRTGNGDPPSRRAPLRRDGLRV